VTSEILLRVYPDLLFAYHGHSLLITDRMGTITGGLAGLYEHDVRLISHYKLLVNGHEPRFDAVSAVDSYSTLAYYVAPPTPDASVKQDAQGLLEHELDRQVVVRVARFVGQGLHEDVEVTNHGLTEANFELAWELAADFADLVEARGGERQQEAPVAVDWQLTDEGGELRLTYQHPQLHRGSIVRFRGPGFPPRREGDRVIYSLKLGPQESRRYCLEVACVVDGEVREPLYGCDAFGAVANEADAVRRELMANATRIRTPNVTVQKAWDRAAADLGALALGDGSTRAEMAVPAAGIPLYGTLFGREALTIAGQSLLLSPLPAEGALRLLAKYVGTKDDDFYDEQPGRVPQQVRDDPLALLRITPWGYTTTAITQPPAPSWCSWGATT
jgi:glycogen debranching enzyme